MRRSLALVWMALHALWLCCAPLARGGSVERRRGKTVIRLQVATRVLPELGKTDTASRAQLAIVKEFRERFPEIFRQRYRSQYQADPAKYGRHSWDKVEIDIRRFSGIQVEGVETDLLAIAGKVPPDVLYVNFRKSDTYIQQGFLYPLDKPEDGYLSAMKQVIPGRPGKEPRTEEQFRIHPKIWPVIRRKGPGGAEHVWAIPFGGALGKVLLFRKDLFDQAGVAYPTMDWTWEDMYHACRKISDPARGIYGLLLGRGKHESWFWITFLWSAGGDVMTYDREADRWRAVFDSREAAVALDYYTRLSTQKWIDRDDKIRRGFAYKDVQWSVGWKKWEDGEIGMHFDYIDEKLFQSINPDVIGMVPVPLGPTGMRGGELNSRMLGLFSGIEDPVVRDAAWEFIRFYDGHEAMGIKTRIMVEGGLGRFVNPRYLREYGYDDLIRLAPKGWEAIFEEAIRTGKPEPYGRHSNIAYDLMTFPIEEANQISANEKLPPTDLAEGQTLFERYRQYIEDGHLADARLDYLHGILIKANDRANEEMIGIVPPAQRRWRRIVAGAVLLALVVTFGAVFRRIVRAFTPPVAAGQTRRGWQFRRYKWAYLLLAPAVASVLVWQYIPLVRGSVMAFFDYKILRGFAGSEPVWLDNFGDVLFHTQWWDAIWNSVRYSLLVIGLTFLPPVVLAILLQEVPRGKILFRTLFYLPAVITGLVVVLLWKSFYEASEHGAMNALLMHVPAGAYLLVGAAMFAVTWAFARRLRQHGSRVLAGGFAVAAVLLLYTCYALARPILMGRMTRLAVTGQTHAPEPYTALGVLAMALGLLGLGLSTLARRHGRDGGALRWGAYLCFGFAATFAMDVVGLTGRALDEGTGGFLARLSFVLPAGKRWGFAATVGLLVAAGVASRIGRRRLAAGDRPARNLPGRVATWLTLMAGACFVLYAGLHARAVLAPTGVLLSRLWAFLPEPYRWLSDPDTAMLCCVLPMVWAGMGPGCLIYLAALKGIAEDYYEAADLDGATFIDKILFIVFPILRPLLIINFVGVFIASWKATANILAMTGGGAETEVSGLHLFYKAFIFLRFGPATAMAWVLGFLLIGFTVNQLRILSRLEFRATGKKA